MEWQWTLKSGRLRDNVKGWCCQSIRFNLSQLLHYNGLIEFLQLWYFPLQFFVLFIRIFLINQNEWNFVLEYICLGDWMSMIKKIAKTFGFHCSAWTAKNQQFYIRAFKSSIVHSLRLGTEKGQRKFWEWRISMICLCSKYVKNCNIFGQILNIWVKLILKKN